jgi:hypothetical protein
MFHGFDSEQYLEDKLNEKLKEFKSKKWYRDDNDGVEYDGFMGFDDCKRCLKECDFLEENCDCDCHIHCKTCGTKISYNKIKKTTKVTCSECKWKEEWSIN